jgi:predicted kinase
MDLVILIGLQGSGKTTFSRAHFAATHEHVSKDCFRHNKKPSRRQAQLIDDALRAERSVVVDNTNPTVADRAPLIALGRAHGARISGYYFEPSVNDSLERNREREGRARVPDVAVFALVLPQVPRRGPGVYDGSPNKQVPVGAVGQGHHDHVVRLAGVRLPCR